MKKKMIIGMLVCLAMLGACTKYAAMKGPVDGDKVNPAFVEYVVDKAEDRLDLTQQQRHLFQAMVQDVADNILESRPEADALYAQIADEVRQPRLDVDKVEGLFLKRMQFFRRVIEEEKGRFAAFHASLTDGQRAALAQLILDHRKKGWHGSH